MQSTSAPLRRVSAPPDAPGRDAIFEPATPHLFPPVRRSSLAFRRSLAPSHVIAPESCPGSGRSTPSPRGSPKWQRRATQLPAIVIQRAPDDDKPRIPPTATALVIGANPIMRMFLEAALVQWRYKAIGARTGSDALRHLKQGVAPDVILIEMGLPPPVSVNHLVRLIRLGDGGASVPILLLSNTLDNAQSALSAVSAGADDFVLAEFHDAWLPLLRKKITSLTDLAQLRLRSEQSKRIQRQKSTKSLPARLDEGDDDDDAGSRSTSFVQRLRSLSQKLK